VSLGFCHRQITCCDWQSRDANNDSEHDVAFVLFLPVLLVETVSRDISHNSSDGINLELTNRSTQARVGDRCD
jgi:hypothetical protein